MAEKFKTSALGFGKKFWKKAEVSNFRWHDLRYTWASRLVQLGVPLSALQEMGGWESVEMVRRYAHLSAEHLQAMLRYWTESDYAKTQIGHSADLKKMPRLRKALI